MNSEMIFALDIGTRQVKGILARKDASGLSVCDREFAEHPTRAMSVGQIQDVPAVAGVVRKVVAELSRRCGQPLTRAAVAVAGRSLKTERGSARLTLGRMVAEADVELCVQQALQQALKQAGLGERGVKRLHCVGYVVTRQCIDGEILPQPCGHYAEELETEVLATLLPRRVLDNIFAAVEAAGLEVRCVTLEPIAALQAAVPDGLRRFNLAIVDIGAGTSDIALSKDGCVRAFGMVPLAGDSITEALSDLYLLDFFAAERLKNSLGEDAGDLEVEDIFHRRRRLNAEDVRRSLLPSVRDLAGRIAEHLLELNSFQPPSAVVCVGGGSLTAGIEEALAEALGLPLERVGVRSAQARLAAGSIEADGPQNVTPLGIAMVAGDNKGLSLRRISVNEQPHYLMELSRPLTALSVLASAGISPERIYGRPGPARTYTANGELRVLKGTGGTPACILVNGEPAELDAPIAAGDAVTCREGSSGEEARALVRDVLAEHSYEIAVQGHREKVYPAVLLDDSPAGLDAEIRDRARLSWAFPTLGEAAETFLHKLGRRRHGAVSEHLRLFRNGRLTEADAVAQAGDVVEILEPGAAPLPPGKPLRVHVNGREIVFQEPPGQDSPALLVDLFRELSFAPGEISGKSLRLMMDGQKAAFVSPLRDGAKIEVFFE